MIEINLSVIYPIVNTSQLTILPLLIFVMILMSIKHLKLSGEKDETLTFCRTAELHERPPVCGYQPLRG